MRQSPQPSRLLVVFVSVAGFEKEELAMALFAAVTLSCVCAASTVVP
jgi:hypothetical protein